MGWLLSDRLLRSGVGLLVLVWMAGIWVQRSSEHSIMPGLRRARLVVHRTRTFFYCRPQSRQEPAGASDIVGTAFLLRLGATILAWAGAVAGVYWLSPGDSVRQLFVIVIATGWSSKSAIRSAWWFEALVESKYTAWARSTAFALAAPLRIGLILADAPLVAFALASAVELAIAGFGIAIVFLSLRPAGFRLGFNSHCAVDLLRDSWALIFRTSPSSFICASIK